MKTVQIACFALFSTLSLSCQNAQHTDKTSTTPHSTSPTSAKTMKKHQYKDAHTGMVVYSKQYPSDWKVVSMASYKYDKALPGFSYQIQGPGGIKAFNSMHEAYTYFDNQELNRTMGAYGMQIRPIPQISALMRREFFPKMQSQGFKYLGEEMATDKKQFIIQKLRKQGLSNVDLEVLTTKWTNDKGQKALVDLALIKFYSPDPYGGQMTSWVYGADYLVADSGHLDTAYGALNTALRSEAENPEWARYKNLLMQRRQQQSAVDHQRRMQASQAQFQSHQQYMKGQYAASDARHNAYMQRLRGTDGSDAGHQGFINNIRDEETVNHPNGQQYQVEGYAKNYWMDSEGNYIKSDDLFYSPNGDINLNNKEWTKLERNR